MNDVDQRRPFVDRWVEGMIAAAVIADEHDDAGVSCCCDRHLCDVGEAIRKAARAGMPAHRVAGVDRAFAFRSSPVVETMTGLDGITLREVLDFLLYLVAA